jgi:serine/threonine protein kinase
MELSDSVLRHLGEVVDLPDLSGTRYELEGELGRGGLGVVYAARDRDLDRRVALKVMDAARLRGVTSGEGEAREELRRLWS